MVFDTDDWSPDSDIRPSIPNIRQIRLLCCFFCDLFVLVRVRVTVLHDLVVSQGTIVDQIGREGPGGDCRTVGL